MTYRVATISLPNVLQVAIVRNCRKSLREVLSLRSAVVRLVRLNQKEKTHNKKTSLLGTTDTVPNHEDKSSLKAYFLSMICERNCPNTTSQIMSEKGKCFPSYCGYSDDIYLPSLNASTYVI